MISIDVLNAEEQATIIGQASDNLIILQQVNFSARTTVLGNSIAMTSFESLQKSGLQIQKLLTRDVEHIRKVVRTFKRKDQEISKKLHIFFDEEGKNV